MTRRKGEIDLPEIKRCTAGADDRSQNQVDLRGVNSLVGTGGHRAPPCPK
jgi:hypothetical protein